MGADAGKVGLMKKSMYGTRDAASNWSVTGKVTSRNGDSNWDSARRICFNHKENRASGLTHGDDFVLTRANREIDGS